MKLKFTGEGIAFVLINLGLALLSMITLGIAVPYWFYWNVKYIVNNIEVQDARGKEIRN